MCKHLSKVGDNYGESCYTCGQSLSGYGYGGWLNLSVRTKCIHFFYKTDRGAVCIYCEEFFSKDQIEERIKALEEKRDEFILNESVFADDHPSWGEIVDAQCEAGSIWDLSDDGKELKAMLCLQD